MKSKLSRVDARAIESPNFLNQHQWHAPQASADQRDKQEPTGHQDPCVCGLPPSQRLRIWNGPRMQWQECGAQFGGGKKSTWKREDKGALRKGRAYVPPPSAGELFRIFSRSKPTTFSGEL